MSEQDCAPGSGEGFRVWVCPVCDYSLAGSSDVGTCPECGRAYDTSAIYLYGNPLGNKRSAWNQRTRGPWQIGWSVLVLGAIGVFVIWPHRHGIAESPLALAFFGWMVCAFCFSWWRGSSDQGSGMAQVKLTPSGVRQCSRGIGPLPYERNETSTLVPWRKVREVQFTWREYYGEIRLSNRKGFFRLNLHREYVHANFACRESDFPKLQETVRQWLAANGCSATVKYRNKRAAGWWVKRVGNFVRRWLGGLKRRN
jgi:hypothetical protein